MLFEDAFRILDDIKPGVFTRFGYTTELPLKAEYLHKGYRIDKVCEITVRFGVSYFNIKSVKQRRLEEHYTTPRRRENNYVTVLPNKIVFNTNTKKMYVNAYPCKKGANEKVTYVVNNPDGTYFVTKTLEPVNHDMVIDSYWKRDRREMFQVAVAGVNRIGDEGFQFFETGGKDELS